MIDKNRNIPSNPTPNHDYPNNLHLCGNIHDTGLLKQKIRVVTAHSRGVVSKQTEQSLFIKVKQPKFQTENESETKNWIPIIDDLLATVPWLRPDKETPALYFVFPEKKTFVFVICPLCHRNYFAFCNHAGPDKTNTRYHLKSQDGRHPLITITTVIININLNSLFHLQRGGNPGR